MKLKEQCQELLRLKAEIGQQLKKGTDFKAIKHLMLYLAGEKFYSKLKCLDNQLAELDLFFNIWLEEKKDLSNLGIETDIFSGISSLRDVEQKYLKILYCGLRRENAVPDAYIGQALEWLVQEHISGLAIGKIIVSETSRKEENLLSIAQRLRQKGEILNTLLLLQYANKTFPGNEQLLLEEAGLWLDGMQWERALENLLKIESPTEQAKELAAELQQVAKNGR